MSYLECVRLANRRQTYVLVLYVRHQSEDEAKWKSLSKYSGREGKLNHLPITHLSKPWLLVNRELLSPSSDCMPNVIVTICYLFWWLSVVLRCNTSPASRCSGESQIVLGSYSQHSQECGCDGHFRSRLFQGDPGFNLI